MRRAAAVSLGQMEAGDKATVEALVETLKDKDQDVRGYAALALGRIGKPSFDSLMALLKGKDLTLRLYALTALGEAGPAAKSMLPALLAALKDSEIGIRIAAAEAVGKLGVDGVDGEEALLGLLKDEDARVRAQAAQALGEVGQSSRLIIPAMANLMKDKNELVRRAAVNTLGEVGPDAPTVALPPVVAALKDEDVEVRFRAVVRSWAKLRPSMRAESKRSLRAVRGQKAARALECRSRKSYLWAIRNKHNQLSVFSLPSQRTGRT